MNDRAYTKNKIMIPTKTNVRNITGNARTVGKRVGKKATAISKAYEVTLHTKKKAEKNL